MKKNNILQIHPKKRPHQGGVTMKAKKSELPERLESVRKGAKLSRAQLARMLNVSVQAVQAWETGKSRPKRERLNALADTFGVNLAWLEHGIGERWASKEESVYGVKIVQVSDDASDMSLALEVFVEKVRNSALPPKQIESILVLAGLALDGQP